MKTPRCVFKEENPITWAKKLDCRYRILSSTNSHIKIKTKNSKKLENFQNCKFQRQKGSNKYNTIGWQIKRSQYLKIHFTAIKTKTLIEYGQKVDFWFYRWITWILDRLITHIIPFEMIVYRPKSELKQIRYHQNTKNPNKIFTLFFFNRKRDSFWPDFAKSSVSIGQEQEWLGWTILKKKVLSIFYKKGSKIFAPDWKIQFF